MGLLFILALLLAWPTAGLSIVVFLLILFGRSFLKAKSRMHQANVKEAERSMLNNSAELPSWSEDRDKVQLFLEGTMRTAIAKGVPEKFVIGLCSDLRAAREFVVFAGALEKTGASFLEQQAACSDKLVGTWNRTSDEGRNETMGDRSADEFNDEIPF
jgi:hypothetical protein